MTSQCRSIYPFGDKTHNLNVDDYLIDCKALDDKMLTSAIRTQWDTLGLIVLKNTGMRHLRELEDWAKVLFEDFTAYDGGSAPRGKWSDTVFQLGDAPATIDLCFHNESCYLPKYPCCLVIGSLKCPVEGGETLLADNEKVTAILLETPVGKALKIKGMRYVRRMTDKYATASDELPYKHWQDALHVDTREEAELYIKAQGWDFEWLTNGTIRTSYCVDAYEYHEKLDKSLFFAGLASHASFFDQWPPFNTLPDEQRPLNMTFGDGASFSQEDILQIYSAYNSASLALNWNRVDLFLLDNLRWAHARPSYHIKEYEERIMGVTMGMMKQRFGNRF